MSPAAWIAVAAVGISLFGFLLALRTSRNAANQTYVQNMALRITQLENRVQELENELVTCEQRNEKLEAEATRLQKRLLKLLDNGGGG